VIIGNGKDGLPIILGNVDTPATAGPKAAEGDTSSAVSDKKAAIDTAPKGPDQRPLAAHRRSERRRSMRQRLPPVR